MNKMISTVFILCILISLCACGKTPSETEENSVLSDPPISAAPVDLSAYQTYTVDDEGNIVDTRSGTIVQDVNLSVNENGNIVMKSSGQIVVSADRVAENKKYLSTNQTNPSVEAAVTSSSNPSGESVRKTVSTTAPLRDDKEDNELYKKYEEMNHQYPIENGSTWMFCSTDPSYRDPHDHFPSENLLTVYSFKVNPDLHTEILFEYYAPLTEYADSNIPEDMIRKIHGVDYVWQMTTIYEGCCFPCMDGTVDIELKCYDAHGNFVGDDLTFQRIDQDTLKLIRYSGDALFLRPGDTFTR